MAEADAIYKVHALTLGTVEARGDSDQKDDDPGFGTPDDAINPPEDLSRLRAWTTINGTRSACLDALVRNTVGLGYAVSLVDGAKRDQADAEDDMRTLRTTLEALAARDTRLGRPTFTKLMMAVAWDYHEVGNGFLEVARDKRSGQISGLFHAPADRMRRRKDRKGWRMVGADGDWNAAQEFSNFGEKVAYARNGAPQPRLQTGGAWATNEVIHFRRHSSESRDYGMPADLSLALEYLGDKLAASANVSFFDSSGVPPTVIYVQGDERKDGSTIHVNVPAETAQRIASTMKAGGGRQDRVAIIPVPPGASIGKIELGKMSDKDMGFTAFRDDMRQRTISAFRISPIFIALGSEGRYDAEVERAITKEQVFDGLQDEWQDLLYRDLVVELGYPDLGVTFTDLAIESDAAQREGATRLAEGGSITRREYRKAFGYGPLPEAQPDAEPEPGQVHHGWNDEVVDLGLPKGAGDRTLMSEDQRGLKPGVGARVARSGPNEQQRSARTAPVEAAVTSLTAASAGRVRGGARRASARARALVDQGPA